MTFPLNWTISTILSYTSLPLWKRYTVKTRYSLTQPMEKSSQLWGTWDKTREREVSHVGCYGCWILGYSFTWCRTTWMSKPLSFPSFPYLLFSTACFFIEKKENKSQLSFWKKAIFISTGWWYDLGNDRNKGWSGATAVPLSCQEALWCPRCIKQRGLTWDLPTGFYGTGIWWLRKHNIHDHS